VLVCSRGLARTVSYCTPSSLCRVKSGISSGRGTADSRPGTRVVESCGCRRLSECKLSIETEGSPGGYAWSTASLPSAPICHKTHCRHADKDENESVMTIINSIRRKPSFRKTTPRRAFPTLAWPPRVRKKTPHFHFDSSCELQYVDVRILVRLVPYPSIFEYTSNTFLPPQSR